MSKHSLDTPKTSDVCAHGNQPTLCETCRAKHPAWQKYEPKMIAPDVLERIMRTAHAKDKEAMGDINIDIMANPIDWKVGERFDAYGITKVSVLTNLRQLTDLLENGIDPKRLFHTAPLEVEPEKRAALGAALGTGGGTAYKDGSFVILSSIDSKLKEGGIKYVLVNDVYYEAVPELQKAYPAVEFIRADETPKRLREIAEELDETKHVT